MKKLFLRMMVFFAAALLLCGCGTDARESISMEQFAQASEEDDDSAPEKSDVSEEDTAASEEQLYIVLQVKKKDRLISFGLPDSLRTLQYSYTKATQILDENGDFISISRLKPGSVVILEEPNDEAKLTTLQLAPKAWYQDNITRFTVDDSIGMLVIGETKYRYDEYLRVFSNKQEIDISQLAEGDIIRVHGVDKQILSIQVVQGHGTIALSNTELFEGGWISLGTKIYAKVTPDMTLEVPEGTYELSVANDGYGDTKTVEVKRSQVTLIDLDEYKGEGPKTCQVTFRVGAPDAQLYIDGEEIDYENPVELRYGIHKLTVIAEGYETWERQLVIHSQEATIDIGESQLTDDGTDSSDDTESDDDSESEDDASSDTTQDTDTTQSTAQTGASIGTDDADDSDSTGDSYSDYLDTITDLLESLTSSED